MAAETALHKHSPAFYFRSERTWNQYGRNIEIYEEGSSLILTFSCNLVKDMDALCDKHKEGKAIKL